MLRRVFLGSGAGWRCRLRRFLVADGHPDHVWRSSLPRLSPDLANGLTTFNAGGCSSCHAVPGQPDRLKLGGGLAIPSPFGTFYAPNISPDPADGIGRWTEADFVTRGDAGAFRRPALITFRPFPIRPTSTPRSKTSAISSPI